MGLQRVAEVDSRRHLRSASTNVLVVPPMRHSTIDDRTFLVTASRVWNSLLLAVTSLQSLSVFKRQLKTAVCPLLQLLMPHTLRCDPVFIFLIVVRCPCSCSTLRHLHCSLSAVTHAPFHASVLRPASQVGPMHEAAEMGEVS